MYLDLCRLREVIDLEDDPIMTEEEQEDDLQEGEEGEQLLNDPEEEPEQITEEPALDQILLELQGMRSEQFQTSIFISIILIFFVFRWGWLNWK